MPILNVVVVGTGDMGGALAQAIAQRVGYHVSVRGARRNSASARHVIAASDGAISEATDDRLRSADVVFVVVPWAAFDAVAGLLSGHTGVIVSVIVPWADGDARRDIVSVAEQMAARLPAARIVSAFTTVSSAVVREPNPDNPVSIIVCADDDGARRSVMDVATELGFGAVNGGPLVSARYTEAMGLLWAALAYDGGYGERVSYRVFVP